MGLIGRVFGAITGIPTASDKALIDTLCLAAASDGDASRLELGYALEIALDLPGFQKVGRKDLEKTIARAVEELKQTGSAEASMRRVADRLESAEEREQAYTLAAVIQFVDGAVCDKETKFLAGLHEVLAVPPERCKTILAEVERELNDAKRSNLMNG
jgi:hypothetical protein